MLIMPKLDLSDSKARSFGIFALKSLSLSETKAFFRERRCSNFPIKARYLSYRSLSWNCGVERWKPACNTCLLACVWLLVSPSPSQCQLQWRSTQEVPHCLHPPAGSGAWERISLQPLPDPTEAGGNCAYNVSIRAPGQDLVSEPEDEVEKGA